MTIEPVGVRTRIRAAMASLRSGEQAGALKWSFAGVAAVQLLGILTGILLARGLGPSDRGAFAAMLLWPSVLITLGDLGLANSFGYYSARERGSLRDLMAATRTASILQSAYLVPIALVLSYVALDHIGVPSLEAGLVLAATFIPASLISRYVAAVLQGQLEMKDFYSLRLSMALGIAVCLIALIATGALTIWGVVGAYLVGMGAMMVVTYRLSRRYGAVRSDTPGEPVERGEFLRYGLRSLPGGLYPVESLYVDQMLIALFLSKYDLGLYVAATAFTSGPRLVAFAIGTTSMPAVAASQAAERMSVLWHQMRVAAVAVGAVSVVLVATAPWLIPALFGDDFRDAVGPAQLLILGSWIYGIRRVLGDSLRGLGEPGLVSVTEVASWPFIVAAAATGTFFGLSGVAIALLAVQALSLAMLLGAWLRRRGATDTT